MKSTYKVNLNYGNYIQVYENIPNSMNKKNHASNEIQRLEQWLKAVSQNLTLEPSTLLVRIVIIRPCHRNGGGVYPLYLVMFSLHHSILKFEVGSCIMQWIIGLVQTFQMWLIRHK